MDTRNSSTPDYAGAMDYAACRSGSVVIVSESNAEGKIGKNEQWLKVKDPTGTEGYVAAWYVSR